MAPSRDLPYPEQSHDSEDQYVSALLEFITSNQLFRVLSGGVHILDFLTSEPSLYSRIFPDEWRDFFVGHDTMDLLDLFMREDLKLLSERWRGEKAPPATLLQYIESVRQLLLDRQLKSSQCSRNRILKTSNKLARHVTVGMNIKKVHEVGLFSHYLDHFAAELTNEHGHEISHLVDFGSGQNYLGRALASEPYERNIVAIEVKGHNAERARVYDRHARLAPKQLVMRNKKEFRELWESRHTRTDRLATSQAEIPEQPIYPVPNTAMKSTNITLNDHSDLVSGTSNSASDDAKHIKYVQHRIKDGNLSDVVAQIDHPDPRLLVMSLHSCGNLVHHGLRSLIYNPSVKAVAMVGCCYNLLTERLRSPTFKLPELRPTTHTNLRFTRGFNEQDPHGFPMSDRFCTYQPSRISTNDEETEIGVHLNITSRMMAVQAPYNWSATDSDAFFTRHFYRALLQRIFLDRKIVGPPTPDCVGGSTSISNPLDQNQTTNGESGGTPITIGSLRKADYRSFTAYVRAALTKLSLDPNLGEMIKGKTSDLTDVEIVDYEKKYEARKKELSVTWSLMAFSAGVIESAIVVDRWCWLKEQKEVEKAWVESVFEYSMSPRNLVVVGIKKPPSV